MGLNYLLAFRDIPLAWLDTAEFNSPANKTLRKTMYDVVNQLTKRATTTRKCSFSELGLARAVEYFVSHWWGEESLNFVAALERVCQDGSRGGHSLLDLLVRQVRTTLEHGERRLSGFCQQPAPCGPRGWAGGLALGARARCAQPQGSAHARVVPDE
eukprot:TRINITY_DN7408_c0_g1_i1.p1 TRINITY_DN7408_c0_g1~~TRINITY_DN7408_c0_g1_i1.p1  ORF type:complete len:157 (+),score=22.69 TRINITY_DN7408_c0_g1_i1:219-689(+)